MAVPSELLELLVCPESRAQLIHFDAEAGDGEAFLFCPSSRLKYRIEDDVPVMLVEEAERLDEGAAEALLARARELGLRGATGESS